MMKLRHFVLILIAVINLSCTAYKKIPYLQNSDLIEISQNAERYTARIVTNDILSIYVNSTDPLAGESFNLLVPTSSTGTSSSTAHVDYIVDEKGTIDFPVLGEISVLNLTCRELEDLIKEKLSAYLVEPPVVTVAMTDFKVSVLGEVASPGVQIIASGKANIFEALAMAGDLTIYGQRQDVKLVREDVDGNRQIVTIDLNDANIIYSDYYYLSQNDVIYVSPNKSKGNTSRISASTTIWISFVSTFMSIASFIMAIML